MEFTSPSTNEVCTAAQLIAEIMCVRKAQKKGINLPYKFWNIDEYRKEYRQQIIAANAILKLYSPLAVLVALKRKDCQWQFSLRVNGLPDAIAEEQKRLDSQEKLISESKNIIVNNPADFRQVVTGQSKKSRLD